MQNIGNRRKRGHYRRGRFAGGIPRTANSLESLANGAKTDPVRFKWGFGEERLKDKFASFEAYKNTIPKRRKLLAKRLFLQAKRALLKNPCKLDRVSLSGVNKSARERIGRQNLSQKVPSKKGSLGVIFSPRSYRENAHSKSANFEGRHSGGHLLGRPLLFTSDLLIKGSARHVKSAIESEQLPAGINYLRIAMASAFSDSPRS